jgi:hypothetical protein
MDALYILGDGSIANNVEIKYSVRALERHLVDLDRLFIVGEDPGWFKDFVHIPCADEFDKTWKNAHKKTALACAHDTLSDEFLFMNDDFFLNAPFVGADFPFYAIKNADGGPNGPHSFQVHCPIRYKKEYYRQMPLSVDMPGQYSPRSFYSNFYKAPPTFVEDFIMPTFYRPAEYASAVSNRDFFSIDDALPLNSAFLAWLAIEYPQPSRFE